MRILILEDEEKLAKSLKLGLENEGFITEYYLDGLEGENYINLNQDIIDLVILDIMLPQKDGLAVCQSLRAENINIPVLILTAKSNTEDKILGLNSGADDYLTKPFSFDELLARVRTLLRRPNEILPIELKVGNLVLNTISRKVIYGNKEITLTLKEFMLLEYFMRHPNQVLNREQILDSLWDINFDSFSNIVDVHIKNLRRKLNYYEENEEILETVHGLGYRLKE